MRGDSARALIFDIGNVLVPFSLPATAHALAQLVGQPIATVAANLLESPLARDYQVGSIDTATFRAGIEALFGVMLEPSAFEVAWNAGLPDACDAPELLLASQAVGWRLVTLSNTNELHARRLRATCPWLAEMTQTVLSHEIGAAKPSEEAFAAAVAQTRLDPGACVFIDDDAGHVGSARELGIPAILFEDERTCRSELERLGFLEIRAETPGGGA